MQIAEEPDRGPVAEAASSGQLGPLADLPGEVPPKPRLALGEEGSDVPLRIGPAAPARGGHGDDHTTVRVDHDPQAARSWRPPERVLDGSTRQPGDRRRLGG